MNDSDSETEPKKKRKEREEEESDWSVEESESEEEEEASDEAASEYESDEELTIAPLPSKDVAQLYEAHSDKIRQQFPNCNKNVASLSLVLGDLLKRPARKEIAAPSSALLTMMQNIEQADERGRSLDTQMNEAKRVYDELKKKSADERVKREALFASARRILFP